MRGDYIYTDWYSNLTQTQKLFLERLREAQTLQGHGELKIDEEIESETINKLQTQYCVCRIEKKTGITYPNDLFAMYEKEEDGTVNLEELLEFAMQK